MSRKRLKWTHRDWVRRYFVWPLQGAAFIVILSLLAALPRRPAASLGSALGGFLGRRLSRQHARAIDTARTCGRPQNDGSPARRPRIVHPDGSSGGRWGMAALLRTPGADYDDSRATGAPLRLPDFARPGYEPLRPARREDEIMDILRMTRAINTAFESWIREHPAQWLCTTRRWPKRREGQLSQASTTVAESTQVSSPP
jgi:lauroyl/myristoyl acyltransferase